MSIGRGPISMFVNMLPEPIRNLPPVRAFIEALNRFLSMIPGLGSNNGGSSGGLGSSMGSQGSQFGSQLGSSMGSRPMGGLFGGKEATSVADDSESLSDSNVISQQ
jgi:hypothetical protein